MKFRSTSIAEVVLIEPQVYRDDRGWFMETYQAPRFAAGLAELGLPRARAFVQDNESSSRTGVVRGLHYQVPPHAQGKLVRVVHGAAFDVAVDIRRSSPTFGRWVGAVLSAENRLQLWIPEGFAHGFAALADDTRLVYRTTDVYAPACERAIRWNDPAIRIDWPLTVQAVLAAKDAAAPLLRDAEVF